MKHKAAAHQLLQLESPVIQRVCGGWQQGLKCRPHARNKVDRQPRILWEGSPLTHALFERRREDIVTQLELLQTLLINTKG
jgi:hypothetical protein